MSSIYDWSLMAASNANSDDNINWQEGQPPSTVNNSSRSMMQRVRELLSDLGGVTSTAGTANIVTFAAKSPFSAYVDGIRICFRAANTNTSTVTLNVNSVGAKPVFIVSAGTGLTGLQAGNITANGIYEVIYSAALDSNSGGWLLLNPSPIQQIPPGAWLGLGAPFVPVGFLYCNGQAVSRTTYAALFNAIGTRWGGGDGSQTFNLPDWRGAFLRGWDDGRGLDSGRAFASYQDSENKSHSHSGQTHGAGEHSHSIPGAFGGSGSAGATSGNVGLSNTSGSAGYHTHPLSIDASGGAESRPKNYTTYFVMKF